MIRTVAHIGASAALAFTLFTGTACAEETTANEQQAYLSQNAELDGVTITDSGLQIRMLKEGEGDKPAATDTVVVHYVGTLIDGSEFDSSYSRNKPAEFPLNRVIAGWTEGLQLMNTGSKAQLVIPANLAYGEPGSCRNAQLCGKTLIFDVELLEIK